MLEDDRARDVLGGVGVDIARLAIVANQKFDQGLARLWIQERYR
jgi:hypothetical protein